MTNLVRLRDIQASQDIDLGADYFDPTGKTVYGLGNDKVGRVEGALVAADTGEIRYFIVDAGGWFTSKEVLVPAGLGRIEGDEVYFDGLSKEQVEAMEAYDDNYNYSFEEQYTKDQAAFVSEQVPAEHHVQVTQDHYRAPKHDKLELLEERLKVNTEKFVSGLVSVGKRVVSEEQRVDVELAEEHAHIERNKVERPTTRKIGEDAVNQIEVELTAERANVAKETYVTEEVSLNKTTQTRTETILETVQREELDVNDQGQVVNAQGQVVDIDGITADDVRNARGL